MTLVKKSLICVGGVFLEGGLQVKVTVKMVEIEVPNLQDWRSTSDGPLHVVFLVHLVSYLVSKQVITVQSSEKKVF